MPDVSSLINSTSNTGISRAATDFSTGSSSSVTNSSSADPQMFIKLLAASMSNQDPMSPSDSNQFLNQMTQYATIESMSKINSSLTDLKTISQSMNMYNVLNSATNTIGKTVEIAKGTGDDTIKGVVESVQFDSDGIYVTVDGKKHQYTQIISIKND